MDLSVVMVSGSTALAVVLTAALARRWWGARAKGRRRIPTHWPLDPRTIANSEECKVWRWLLRVFFDHYVMVKVPVTRFTFPRAGEDTAHWYQLLTGVYCTFTVCGPDGAVVGCVDVPGRKGLSRGNRKLKETLLSQCGIGYWIVHPRDLPTLAAIRSDFLGERAGMASPAAKHDAAVVAARQKLRGAIEHQRHKRATAPAPRAAAAPDRAREPQSVLPDSGFVVSGWQQPNSFVAPLDSRRAVFN